MLRPLLLVATIVIAIIGQLRFSTGFVHSPKTCRGLSDGAKHGAFANAPRLRNNNNALLLPTPTPSLALGMAAGNPLTATTSVLWGKGATLWTTTSRPVRALLLLASAFLVLLCSKESWYQRLLWPTSQRRDTSRSEPLPPTSLGCPFLGHPNMFAGSKEHGPFAAVAKVAATLGNASIFRMYLPAGNSLTSVSGRNNIRTVLRREFEDDGINTMMINDNYANYIGGESILYEGDKKTHTMLRRLVGAAMSQPAVSAAVPAIQAVAQQQVDTMLKDYEGKTVKMEDVVTEYTLDIAHRQILGLDLPEDGPDVEEFRRQVKDWLAGLMNPILYLPFSVPFLKRTKGYRAHDYLVSKVEEKLERLDRDGPDQSTLSSMYFATDEEETGDSSTTSSSRSSSRRLSRKQVIDNALILIVAGTETSSSTLTVAMLLLGLYPKVWEKIQAEQVAIISKYGPDLTMANLEECHYLDAVIKETMRIRPIDGLEARKTKETIVVDGTQIPKDSLVYINVRQTHAEDDPATYQPDGSHMDIQQGFDPGRWMDADKTHHPSVFLAFGEGGRRCLGERLAMTEMKVFLATLARRVDFDLVRFTKEDPILWNKNAFMSRPIDGTEIIPRAAKFKVEQA